MKNKLFYGVLYGCICFSLSAKIVFADSTGNIQIQSIESPQLQSDSQVNNQELVQNQIKQWGLSVDEYQHYQWLMNNTPSRYWYKDLDPVEVLALNAKNDQEMMQYALIQARNMHERVTQELKFNKLYAKAYQTLYPNERPINSNLIKPSLGERLQSGDHVWLFADINMSLGHIVCQHLLGAIRSEPDTVLDIYFVDDGLSDHTIRSWIKTCNIQSSEINHGITLNDGNARFNELTQGKNQTLPLIGIVRDKRFQPIDLSSVLQH